MPRYRVPFNGYASASVEVESDETDPEKIVKLAYREGPPGICAQCAGWGQKDSLEIGDEWEVATKEDGTPEIYNLDEE